MSIKCMYRTAIGRSVGFFPKFQIKIIINQLSPKLPVLAPHIVDMYKRQECVEERNDEDYRYGL